MLKQLVGTLVLIYFGRPGLGHTIKNKLYKILDYRSRDKFDFGFLLKGLTLDSPMHFVYDFSRKMFVMLYSINWSNFVVWLPLLLRIGLYVYRKYCYPVCDAITLEINIAFLSRRFSA